MERERVKGKERTYILSSIGKNRTRSSFTWVHLTSNRCLNLIHSFYLGEFMKATQT